MGRQIPTEADMHYKVANSRNLYPADDMDGRQGMFCTQCDTIIYAHEEAARLIRDRACPFCGGIVYWISPNYQPKQV